MGAMPEAGKAIAPMGRSCGSSPRGFPPQATLARGMRLRYTGVPPGERHVQNPAAVRPARLFAGTRCRARGRFIACRRSEEHTSELQSLMRISYAVFFLKKTN